MARPHHIFPSICLSCCVFWALLGLSPSQARAEADEAAQACTQSIVAPDTTIASCSALIDSASV
ncbi:MAG: hypothetical protein ACXU9C_24040, partial [Xanthobacteraceae bacterium]